MTDVPATPENTQAESAPTQPDQASAADVPAKKAAKKAAAKKAPAKKAAKKAAEAPADSAADSPAAEAPPAKKAPAKKAAPKKTAAKKTAAPEAAPTGASDSAPEASAAPMVLFQAPKKTAKKAAAKKTAKKSEPRPASDESVEAPAAESGEGEKPTPEDSQKTTQKKTQQKPKKKAAAKTAPEDAGTDTAADTQDTSGEADGDSESGEAGSDGEGGAKRRPRRRGGRRRRGRGGNDDNGDNSDNASDGDNEDGQRGGAEDDSDDDGENGDGSGSRRRRTRVRKPRNPEDEITSVSGSTRLEAKKQRRREGREAGRRRAPIVSEAEFLARRESVDRTMVIRQRDDLTQIAVLEDKVLVEHYVARESQTSLIGNVYLGRVQNVLPSMEAAFIDIGKGRNAVLYAGEVNWSALGHKDGQPRKVESVLQSGQTILVQVTKDPIGHKGARLTGQISLPGRFLVYVPDGNTSGISRKLPDTERNRLKTLLKEIVPDTAGVIVRTAAEGASEDELTQDVERLTARWSDIEQKVKAGKGPELLYGEPDLTLKVVRDLFTEDFAKLVIQGEDAWDLVDNYVSHVAPDLRERLERFEARDDGKDVFASHRIDEQIAKGLDRKVWLPSGGSLVIDRTEAMTVVDVNTGKFTGSGGNLEETVTKNNLEAAEEIVRQLRLRDIGGIIVVDFIDMVLESNRDLVLRRLVECLGRDRTRHQVAEVTSLGLVQMTRKRIGTGLLEAFSTDCEHCKGRGVVIHDHPIEESTKMDDDGRRGGGRNRGGRNRGGRGQGDQQNGQQNGQQGGSQNAKQNGQSGDEAAKPSPKDLAGTRPPEKAAEESTDDVVEAAPAPVVEVVAETAVAPSVEAPVETPVEKPVEAPAEEPVSEPVSEPEPPRLVTSTRRRSARRPAGPPVVTEPSPTDAVAVETAEEAPEETRHEAQQDTPEEPEADVPETTPEDSVHNAAEGDADDATRELDEDEQNALSLLHVPVKRKGSRKR